MHAALCVRAVQYIHMHGGYTRRLDHSGRTVACKYSWEFAEEIFTPQNKRSAPSLESKGPRDLKSVDSHSLKSVISLRVYIRLRAASFLDLSLSLSIPTPRKRDSAHVHAVRRIVFAKGFFTLLILLEIHVTDSR